MNNLKIVLLAIIEQVIFILLFSFVESFDAFIIPIILLVIMVLIYIFFFGKICKKLKMEQVKFDITYAISWIMLGLLNSYIILDDNVISKLIVRESTRIGELRYLLIPVYFAAYLLIVLIYCIINYLTKVKKK